MKGNEPKMRDSRPHEIKHNLFESKKKKENCASDEMKVGESKFLVDVFFCIFPYLILFYFTGMKLKSIEYISRIMIYNIYIICDG